MITGYTHFGGEHTPLAGLRNILIQKGVTAPHTGEPFGEAMLLGIGGGLGGGFWVFQFGHTTALVLGFRHKWHLSDEFVKLLCERLGTPAEVQETGSKRAAEAALRQALDSGNPPILWLDKASLPYLGLPEELRKHLIHTAVVCGEEDGGNMLLMDDGAAVPWRITAAELATARAIMPYLKQRLLTVDVPGPVGPDALKEAVAAGIRVGCEEALNPPIKNFGLPAIKKWADLVAHPKDKKGWPTAFPPGRPLFSVLSTTFSGIEMDDTGGGALRGMYADFLDEAAAVLDIPALVAFAGEYRTIARQWSDLAEAALPSDVGPFRKTKELLCARRRLLLEQGPNGADAIAALDRQLAGLESEIGDAFPLSGVQTQALLDDLRTRLLALYKIEADVTTALQQTVS